MLKKLDECNVAVGFVPADAQRISTLAHFIVKVEGTSKGWIRALQSLDCILC